jgi:hypothetical protein
MPGGYFSSEVVEEKGPGREVATNTLALEVMVSARECAVVLDRSYAGC